MEPYRWRRISDLYEAVGISSKIGDKILDRLECCWRYIVCRKGTGIRSNRRYCIPTLMGLIAIFSKLEYYSKLREHLLAYCGDPSDREHMPRLSNELMLHGIASSLTLRFFKSVDDLRALINDIRTTLLNYKRFRNAITEFFTEPLNDEEIKSIITARLRLPKIAPASSIIDKLLNSLMNDELICAELDEIIFKFIGRFLSRVTTLLFERTT